MPRSIPSSRLAFGRPVLLKIDAGAAHAAGIPFYRENENFWLVDSLPATYLRVVA